MSSSSNVIMYSSKFCPFCIRAKHLLGNKGVQIEEIIVDSDQVRRQEMMRKSGRRTVPQIWIGETHVGGCDELYALERKGALDGMLAQQ